MKWKQSLTDQRIVSGGKWSHLHDIDLMPLILTVTSWHLTHSTVLLTQLLPSAMRFGRFFSKP